MQPFSIIITVCEKDHTHLPHVIQCLLNQTYKQFETIVMVDGRTLSYDPEIVVKPINGRVIWTDKADTCGFRQRHEAMEHAKGDYLIWLNADNLVYPTFVQTHKDNLVYAIANPETLTYPTDERLPPISIINIHYWLKQSYWGVLPRELSCGNFDLLNYCLHRDVAKRVDACGCYATHGGEEDWYTFERAKRIAPVIWHRNQSPVACHF